jgi:DNA polymerase I-like protein with 3'-5' exonuclease and polymerase domains
MARKAPYNNGTLPMYAPKNSWLAPNLADLPDWSRAKRIALDTEFKDKTLRELGCGARRGAKLAGYSFKLDGDSRAYYVPIRHPGGNNCPEQPAIAYARDNMRRFKGKVVMANGSGDLDILSTTEQCTFDYNQVTIQDVQVAGPLIWELHHSYSLENEGARRGQKGKDKTALIAAAIEFGAEVYHRSGKNKGKETKTWPAIIPDLPSEHVGSYAEHDAAILLPIIDEQERILEAKGLMRVWDLECRLLPVLLKIRQRGVRIDFQQLDLIEKWAAQEERQALSEIARLSGINIGFDNIMNAGACAMALHAIGAVLPRTDSGQWSVTTAVLAAIDHPVATHMRYCRQVYKLRRTFVASIRKYETNGRIHGTLRQIVGVNEKNEKSGAAFGRLSHAHPNTAQQPSMAKFAAMWRKIFLPEQGALWAVNDLSQQEPRWTTHFAAKYGCDGAAEAAKAYHDDPRIDNHNFMARLTGLDRKWAKFVFLALCYGEGGKKLCQHQLKLPTRWRVTFGSYKTGTTERFFNTEEEAVAYRKSKPGRARILEVAGEEGQRILDTFSAKAPYIKQLSDLAMAKAEEFGHIKILGGRMLNFSMDKYGAYEHTYKTLNKLIQGTSGYQVKLWMLEADAQGFYIQLQRHDDIAGSVGSPMEAKRIGAIGAGIVRALVPFRVDTEVGTSDGDIHQLCAHRECGEHAVKDARSEAEKISAYWCEHHAREAA